MTDFSPPLTLREQAEHILASITDDQAERLRLDLLAASAQGEGVDAICDFGELVFGVVAAKHHRAWVAHLLDNLRTGIVAPPESAKTTWITKITVAWWIGKYPLLTNGICSAGDKASQKMAAGIADTIESNPRWLLVFPKVRPDKERGWSSEGYHVQDLGVDEVHGTGEWARRRYGTLDATLTAAGVGSSIWNGVRITGIFAFDDAHDRRSKTQEQTCLDTVDFFNDTALPRATAEAHVVVVQTRWNQKDVIAKIKGLTSFRVFEHPAIIHVEGQPDRSYWPEQWPMERLRQREIEITPIVFDLVYQGNDKALEGHILKTAWLHPFPFLDIRKEWSRYFGVDFAQKLEDIAPKKGDDNPDRFALSVWADAGPRLVLEQIFAEVLYMGEAEELFFAKAGIYRPRNSGVEVNGASAKKYYLGLLNRQRLLGHSYVITPVTRSSDKATYYSNMAPHFDSGQVLVSDELSPGLELFRSEWAAFPKGHDDCLDAAYNGWHIISHLLPNESAPKAQERAAAQAGVLTPAQMIDRAYG
jgi:phage terminase large subunit-like protein